eukprot:826611_1
MEPAALSHQPTVESIDEFLSVALEENADTSSSKDNSHIFRCRRPTLNDFDAIHEFAVMHAANEPNVEQKDCNSIGYLEVLRKVLDAKGEPIPICIVLEEAKSPGSYELRGFALWTFGYSTWKGRVVNLDAFVTSSSGIKSGNENNRKLMMCLVRMARILDCTRIVHQARGSEVEVFRNDVDADLLEDWLTLGMESNDMKNFLASRNAWGSSLLPENSVAAYSNLELSVGEKLENDSVSIKIDTALSNINEIVSNLSMEKINLAKNESKIQMRLRRATGSDAESILKLVQGLALYEKASHEVSVTAAIYRRDGDGDDDDDDDRSPLFHCILVEAVTTTKSTEHGLKDKYSIKVVGMGFWYLGYSLDSGKYLYLEDLFIEPEYRGCGCGKALMYSLADIALNLSCNRFLWQALKWNTPALGFYNSIGAKVYEGLMTLRLDQDKIDAFSL